MIYPFAQTKNMTHRVGSFGLFGFGMTHAEYDTKRADLKSAADAIDSGLRACKTSDPSLARAWDLFYARWRDYYANESTDFNAPASTLLDWEVKMGVWQKRIADAGCKDLGEPLPTTKQQQKDEEPSTFPWWAPWLVGGVIVTAFAFTPIGAAVGGGLGMLIDKVRK